MNRLEKMEAKAAKILENEAKEAKERKIKKTKDYIEMKKLRGYTQKQAEFMAKELIKE
tara:strand:+ start:303 stop:476 length:174 start_codon:yes stop_codon:yes gene_type:complete